MQKLVFALVFASMVSSCASSPEKNDSAKSDVPQNVDSDITFDGVSDPNEDPFFSDEPQETIVEAEPETPAPTPTPEPSAPRQAEARPAANEESEMPQASWEMDESESSTPTPVETPMPKSESPQKARSTPAKKLASTATSDAMRTPASDCSLRAEPGSNASKLGLAKKGRKVWTENHNEGWFKVYRKEGHAFLSKSCF